MKCSSNLWSLTFSDWKAEDIYKYDIIWKTIASTEINVPNPQYSQETDVRTSHAPVIQP